MTLAERFRSYLAHKLFKREFEAIKSNRFRTPPSTVSSGNSVISTSGPKLRAWARHLDENHDLTIGVLDTLINNIIGTGLTIQPMVARKNGALATKVNDRILELWNEWAERPEVTHTISFSEVQRLACRSWLRDGEVLAQHVMGTRSDYRHMSSIPYSLEMIEADLLPFDMVQELDGVVNGVEVNAWGGPIAYHLYLTHPGDMLSFSSSSFRTKRVPADQIIHLKHVRRFNQIRGQSILHGVITRIDDLKDYEESERIAARVAAAFTGYIKKSADLSAASYDDDGNRSFEMNPGMVFDTLQPGEEVGTIESNRPNTALQDFRNAMLRGIASGTGTNYSTISKDYSGTYSSQRQGIVESTPAYTRMREFFISQFMMPVYKRFIQMAVVSGQLQVASNLNMNKVDFGGVAMPWVDPLKEVQADLAAVGGRLKSRHQVIRERGGDPRIVDEQIQLDLEMNPQPEEPQQTQGKVVAL